MRTKIKSQFNFLKNLSNVTRFSQSTMCHSENVLEHSASVAMLAFFVAETIENSSQIENLFEIDYGLMFQKALFHDADEVITGDIARPVKYHSAKLRNLIAEMEKENMKMISLKLSDKVSFYRTWEQAKTGKEGLIVKFCDSLSVVYKLHDEVLIRGNRSMAHLATNKLLDYLSNSAKDIYYAFDMDQLSIDNPLIPIVSECAEIISRIRLQEEPK